MDRWVNPTSGSSKQQAATMAGRMMAFASSSRLHLLLSSPSTPSPSPSLLAARTRTTGSIARSISFLASTRSTTTGGHGTAVFCYSSSSSEATFAPAPLPQPAAEGGGEEKDKVVAVEELAGLLDIRVGRVVKAWRHPEADTLYVEEVDVGEEQPRTICSGLVNYLPLEQLQDSNVIVLANLKPRNMRGIKSNGMLMAASDASHENVEVLRPPEGSVPGERIWFGSEDEKHGQPEPATPNQVQKKKIWESVQPHLRTSDNCKAFLGEHPMRTLAGAVFCKSLQGARVS